jgi:hypothetical protein
MESIMSITLARNEFSSGSRWSLVAVLSECGGCHHLCNCGFAQLGNPARARTALHDGEPFVWVLFVLPIFAIFALVNLFWGAHICSKRRWRNGYLWLMAAAVWLIAACVDFAHH